MEAGIRALKANLSALHPASRGLPAGAAAELVDRYNVA
jgi:hypothetical protein